MEDKNIDENTLEEAIQDNVEQEDSLDENQADEKVETTPDNAETSEVAAESVESQSEDAEDVEETEEESADSFYETLLAKVKEFIESPDWAYVANEFANINLHIGDGPAPDTEKSKELYKEYEALKTDFEERRQEHYEQLNKKREENLAKKKELLKEFAEIVNAEKWTATKEVSQITNTWNQIRQLPSSEIDTLNERFDALMKEFESHKVDRLVKKLEKEDENLTLKLVLQDKMDVLLEKGQSKDSDFEQLSKELEGLIKQWRKIGRVPNDKNESVWERFNNTIDEFNDLRFKYDKKYRKSIEKALATKKKLVAEAELLVEQEDIARAARRVNKLHKAWKKAKNLPQKDENELWEKFKAATDSFNEKKSENMDLLKEQEQQNYELKLKLIEKAESIQNTDDYEAGHKVMQLLMEEWKEIGPVPRKKSSKIWKKFKGAMDVFYEERRDHFKDIRKDQKDNLTAKKEILDKLDALGEHEDPAAAVDEAKKLQEEFKKIGHVPLKYKNKIWKQYREVCDVIYGRFRAMGADIGMERKLASQGVEPKNRKQIIKLEKELNQTKKEISKLEAESIQYEEAKTYFKPTKKGNKLLDELQEKIDKSNAKLETKRQRQNEIEIEIDKLMNADD